MTKIILTPVLLAGITVVAMAQAPAPNDSVTVSGTKEEQAVARFVEASVTPTRMTGKTARWETPICPAMQGIKPEDAAAMLLRLKKNAADAGVRVNNKKDCDSNIEIIFTEYPHAVMDQVKETQPDLLGYFDSSAERDRLATVKRPIQAWYRTATQDIRGHSFVDGSRTTDAPGRGTTAVIPCHNTSGNRQLQVRNGVQLFQAVPGSVCVREFNYVKTNTPGFALQDGLRSQFDHISIIVDTEKVAKMKADAVTDYISMVALAQLSSVETCQGLASITNILVTGCAQGADTLTVNDLGYLRGVYQSDPTLAPQTQKNEIGRRMLEAVAEK
jgi:hypothetical protein